MMLPVMRESPPVLAWSIAGRSIAWFAASRTRRSCHGDFGSHWSGNESQCVDGYTGFRVNPGVRRSSSASSPTMEKATSASPRLSATRRVDGSGMTRNTRRLIAGALRQ